MIKPLRSFAVLLLSLIAFTHVNAQPKIVKKLFSNEADTTRSGSFLPLPVIGYAQETGLEFGVISLHSFYTYRNDTITRASRITGVATLTTKKQSNFQLKSDIWSPANKYHYISEFRYKNFPFSFYGTGDQTRQADEDRITQKLFRLNAEVEKAFGRIFYTGLSVNYESYDFTDKETGGIFSSDLLLKGREGGKALFLGISQTFDNRNSNTYTTKGNLLKLGYQYVPSFFGKDNFSGGLFKAELRSFKSLNEKLVVGLNARLQSIGNGDTPFYLLPQLGNDELMRGYYTGRYRDENLLAMQTELRFRFHPRLGITGFAGTGTVYGKNDFKIAELKPSLGGGLRYFFDIEKGLSVRMDYGIGEKRPGEKRQKGFYLSLGESF